MRRRRPALLLGGGADNPLHVGKRGSLTTATLKQQEGDEREQRLDQGG